VIFPHVCCQCGLLLVLYFIQLSKTAFAFNSKVRKTFILPTLLLKFTDIKKAALTSGQPTLS
jgi:hypothetical protein